MTWMRFLSLGAIVWSAAITAGCGNDEATAPEDVVYESGGTDEAWLELDDATILVDDASAPALTSPTGAIAKAGPAPTFTWEGGAVAAVLPRNRSQWLASADRPSQQRHARFLRAELRALLGIGVARAHEPPVSGPLWRLVFTIPGASPLRVLTGTTTYTPSTAAWQQLGSATGPISLEIVGAHFTTGRITEGPFRRSMHATITLQ